MKKISLFIFAFFSFFTLFPKVFAYVVITQSDGVTFNPVEASSLNLGEWSSGGRYLPNSNGWMVSAGQYWGAGSVSGTFIVVDADYSVGFRQVDGASINNVLYNELNTLKASNLRCAIGDFGQGYNSTYLPEVSNFSVEFNTYDSIAGGNSLYRIKFHYKQQIPKVNKNITNMSCWFERNPSGGLFLQIINANMTHWTEVYYKNNSFTWAVTDDPTDAILGEVNSSINSMKDTIDSSINNMKDVLKNAQDKNNELLEGEDTDTSSKKCGVICKLKGIFTGIIELPGKIVNLLVEGLKSLFVPTNEQIHEIIQDSGELAENFGFVGQSVDFLLDLFSGFLGLVNGEGCITLPEFTIGSTSLFDEHTFWEEKEVCLSSNVVLSKHINTIRVITSIAVICLFINSAYRKFFTILSKEDSEHNGTDSYTGEVKQ